MYIGIGAFFNYNRSFGINGEYVHQLFVKIMGNPSIESIILSTIGEDQYLSGKYFLVFFTLAGCFSYFIGHKDYMRLYLLKKSKKGEV
jgi:hypothetical protein